MTPHVRSDRLRNPHGFFGRRGGVSDAPYDCLNCGLGSDDDPAHVRESRDRVRRTLGAHALQTCHQIHSATALFLDAPSDTRPQADGLVTRTPGLALGALHADCAPVLFEADGIVGACHAGWRGAVGGITDATIALMREHGATAIRAVIGPTISLQSYEVGEGFRDTALSHDPETEAYFTSEPVGERPWIGDALHFDLPSYIAHRIAREGVDVGDLDLCTYAAPQAFFSYRYNTHHGIPDYGRNLSAIMLD